MAPVRHAKLGIALGSGSARGLAHIGILQALAENGVEPDIIAGSSIGAMVGGSYACGHIDAFSKWAGALKNGEIFRYLDLRWLAGGGMASGNRLMDYLRDNFGDCDIKDLNKPFAAVATDLLRGREVWIQDGKLWDAVRASIAIPGVLTPVERDNRWLIDGGVVNPVPVSLCKAMGADIIIAVNLNSDLLRHRQLPQPVEDQPERELATEAAAQDENEEGLLGRLTDSLRDATESMRNQWFSGGDHQPPGMLNVMLGAINIMQDRLTRSRLAGEPADLVLSPRLSHIGLMEFNRGADAIAEGRACVERMLPALRHALEH
ncbi:MAG TPA: patatin-like phospholipase family protein [Spongiibacteraceae bacterium]|nr:patatin-like phospholipase family protein [Spongiibacteraceae bacterium]